MFLNVKDLSFPFQGLARPFPRRSSGPCHWLHELAWARWLPGRSRGKRAGVSAILKLTWIPWASSAWSLSWSFICFIVPMPIPLVAIVFCPDFLRSSRLYLAFLIVLRKLACRLSSFPHTMFPRTSFLHTMFKPYPCDKQNTLQGCDILARWEQSTGFWTLRSHKLCQACAANLWCISCSQKIGWQVQRKFKVKCNQPGRSCHKIVTKLVAID